MYHTFIPIKGELKFTVIYRLKRLLFTKRKHKMKIFRDEKLL